MSAPARPRRRWDFERADPDELGEAVLRVEEHRDGHGLAAEAPDEAEPRAEAVAQPEGVLRRRPRPRRRVRTRAAGRARNPRNASSGDVAESVSTSSARARAERRGGLGRRDHELRAGLDLEARGLEGAGERGEDRADELEARPAAPARELGLQLARAAPRGRPRRRAPRPGSRSSGRGGRPTDGSRA